MREIRTRIDGSGRVLIPAADRRALGLRAGDEVVLRLEESVAPADHDRGRAVRDLRKLTRRYVPEGESLTDDLIAQRRAEASRE